MRQEDGFPVSERDPWTLTREAQVVLAEIAVPRLFDPQLIDRLDRSLRAEVCEHDDLIIDLSEVRFISSAMLGRMVMLWLISMKHGRRVVLCGVTGTLAEIMRIAGLHQRVEMFADQGAARAALRNRQL